MNKPLPTYYHGDAIKKTINATIVTVNRTVSFAKKYHTFPQNSYLSAKPQFHTI